MAHGGRQSFRVGLFWEALFSTQNTFCEKAIIFTDRHTFRKALPRRVWLHSFHKTRGIQRRHHAVVWHGSFGYIFIFTNPKAYYISQVAIKLPFKYGKYSREKEFIHSCCRLNDFSSRCALLSSFQPIAMGTVARGLIEKADPDYDTAQLVEWSCASAA